MKILPRIKSLGLRVRDSEKWKPWLIGSPIIAAVSAGVWFATADWILTVIYLIVGILVLLGYISARRDHEAKQEADD